MTDKPVLYDEGMEWLDRPDGSGWYWYRESPEGEARIGWLWEGRVTFLIPDPSGKPVSENPGGTPLSELKGQWATVKFQFNPLQGG